MEKPVMPSMEHTFTVDLEGNETKKRYSGEFTYTRPTIHKRSEIEKMATRLNGELANLPVEVIYLNNMRATLYFCLSNPPEWWTKSNSGGDLYDINVITDIFNECTKFDEEWKKRVWGDKKEDILEPKK